MAKYELITFDELGAETVAYHEERAGVRLADLYADIVAGRARLDEGSSSHLPNSLACIDPTVKAEGILKKREETRAWLMLQILSEYRGANDKGERRFSLSAGYRKVGVSAMTIIKWREIYPTFSSLVDSVQAEMVESLREEAYRRAAIGHDEPLVHQGLKTGETVKRFSDTLLQFTLMGYDAKFRKQDINMNHSGSVETNVNIEGLRDRLTERLKAKAKAESSDDN
jgi:hypothetical protein